MGSRETLKAIHQRGDLLPWLNGETECFHAELFAPSPAFNDDHSCYTFHPKSPAEVLRPWDYKELWDRRDCWFRGKDGAVAFRVAKVDNGGVTFTTGTTVFFASHLRDDYEYLTSDGVTWLPCGVWVTKQ